MTLAARLASAAHVRARLEPLREHVDVELLARHADYAREVRTLCRSVGGLDDCIRLLDALMDAMSRSTRPRGPAGIRPEDLHPAFADTLADPLA
ncbi:hypothetical protein [Rhizobacter sp. LjRoot28]|jgi:hypothetical protein|uniref:hypothetical protein n=1 Tax=Rhizobacter sp. LjRoot28 TaxID=3342309 RepID=UPI003ECFBBB6